MKTYGLQMWQIATRLKSFQSLQTKLSATLISHEVDMEPVVFLQSEFSKWDVEVFWVDDLTNQVGKYKKTAWKMIVG